MVKPGRNKTLRRSRAASLDASQNNNGETSSTESGPVFPIEVFSEILSWLPAKSLVRCKCVCKDWCNLIENRSFTIKHSSRSSPRVRVIWNRKKESLVVNGVVVREKFRIMRVFAGLVVEKGDISHKFRLRNLTTQEIVYLPDPRPHIITIYADIHDYPSGEIKLVSVHSKNNNSAVVEGLEYLNFDRDDKWRPLIFPVLGKPERSRLGSSKFLLINNTFYHVRSVNDGSKFYRDVYSFDMRCERCFSNTLPQRFFSDLSKVLVLHWDGYIAFGDIEEDKLNVVVLEDHKKHKWSETKIVFPLTYLKEYPHMKKLVPAAFEHGSLVFQSDNQDGRFLCYDIRSRKLTQTFIDAGPGKKCTINPSVVTFKRNVT